MSKRLTCCLFFCLAALCWLRPTSLLAQTNDTPQILFLHLELTNQTVRLLDTVIRPGALKRSRDAGPGDVQYELLSETGEALWKGAVADPGLRHLEYEEPPGSGQLKRKTVLLKQAEFMVRVPLTAQAKRVEFYKLEASAAGESGMKALTRKSLGSVAVP